MDTMLTETEMLVLITGAVSKYGSQKALADAMDISPAYLNDILHGRRAISDEVAAFFGRKLVKLYVFPDEDKEQS